MLQSKFGIAVLCKANKYVQNASNIDNQFSKLGIQQVIVITQTMVENYFFFFFCYIYIQFNSETTRAL